LQEQAKASFRRATLSNAYHIACATRALVLGPAANSTPKTSMRTDWAEWRTLLGL